jgi:hypothetical protein
MNYRLSLSGSYPIVNLLGFHDISDIRAGPHRTVVMGQLPPCKYGGSLALICCILHDTSHSVIRMPPGLVK